MTDTAVVVGEALIENGSATYQFDIDWQVSPNAALESPLILHTGSIATALAPGCDGVAELAETHAATSTISIDPNIWSEFSGDAAQALSLTESVVARSDVVKASDEDMRWPVPNTSPEALATRWLGLGLGPALVAVTFGADGSSAICAAGEVRIPAYPAEVVDTIGAGDAFMTGLIDGLWGADLLGEESATDCVESVLSRCDKCSRSPPCPRPSPSHDPARTAWAGYPRPSGEPPLQGVIFKALNEIFPNTPPDE